MNRLEKVLQRIKENKILVAIILIGIIVIGVGDFSDAINKIQELFGKPKQDENTGLNKAIEMLGSLSKVEDEIKWLDTLLEILKRPNNSDSKNKAQFLTKIILFIKKYEKRKIWVLGIKEKKVKISELNNIIAAIAFSKHFLENKKLQNTPEFTKVYKKLKQILNET